MRLLPHAIAVTGTALMVTASIAAVPAVRAADPVTTASADARTARVHAAVGDPWSRRIDPAEAIRTAALAAVEADEGVALADGGRCAPDDLAVSYIHPGAGWASGAWVGELGPAPTADTTTVNGIVRCAGSHHAFVGFEAILDGRQWVVGVVPDPHTGDDHDHEPANVPDPDAPEQPAPAAPTAPAGEAPVAASAPLVGRSTGPAIEGYARYEPQTTCSSSAQVGSVALRDLLLRTYPGTRSLGIVRGCGVGGRSEHKEGRAFDWGVLAGRPTEKAAADDFVARLTAPDEYGNGHALARRMGVMYAIWNGRIWSAYNANAGWRAYNGSSPHTDHVHISLSWAGARGQTSFWTGQVVEGFPAAPVGGGGGGVARSDVAAAVGGEPRTEAIAEATSTVHEHEKEELSQAATDAASEEAAERAERRARAAAKEAEKEAETAARRARREAERRAEEAAERAEEEAERAEAAVAAPVADDERRRARDERREERREERRNERAEKREEKADRKAKGERGRGEGRGRGRDG